MPSRHLSLPSIKNNPSRWFDLDRAGAGRPEAQRLSPQRDPPAPAEIFLELGVAVAAACGLAVIVGLAV